MKRALALLLMCGGCTLVVGDPDPNDRAGGGLDFSIGACADVQSDAKNCGACGHDCTRLPGVDPFLVRCTAGVCDLRNACLSGRADCSGGYVDGCETDLTVANHCGSCTAVCGGDLPLCARDAVGAYTCAATCPAATPTECGSSCADTFNDPQHCGNCSHVCPTPANSNAVCQNGNCGSACNAGFHTCNGTCLDDTSLQSCGTLCTPCPSAPANAVEICDPFGGCDFQCDNGFVRSNGSCVPGMSSMDMTPAADLLPDNRPACDCSGLAMACLLGCVGHNCCSECTTSGFPFCTTTCVANNSCKPS